MTELKEYECIMQDVRSGNQGPYAVATCEYLGGQEDTITFSCQEPVWT